MGGPLKVSILGVIFEFSTKPEVLTLKVSGLGVEGLGMKGLGNSGLGLRDQGLGV